MKKKVNVLAPPDVRSDAPKDRTDEQTNVLPKLKEGAFEIKFIDNRRENESSYDLKARYGDHTKKKSVILQARDYHYSNFKNRVSEENHVQGELIRTRTSQTQRR